MVPIGMRHHGNCVCLLFDCEVDTAFSLLYQHSNDTNLHFRGQTSYLNNSPISPSKSLLKSSSGEGNHSLPGLSWFERHNLIGWFFCQKRFHWLTQSTGLNNPVLSESSDNVQLTICAIIIIQGRSSVSNWSPGDVSLFFPPEYIDGFIQKRCSSITNALESCLFCMSSWYIYV